MGAREILKHPVTALMVVLTALAQAGVGLFEPLWSLISATSGMWFPAIAVTAGTIFPEIGLGGIGTQALLVAAAVFVAVQLDKLLDRAHEWAQNR